MMQLHLIRVFNCCRLELNEFRKFLAWFAEILDLGNSMRTRSHSLVFVNEVQTSDHSTQIQREWIFVVCSCKHFNAAVNGFGLALRFFPLLDRSQSEFPFYFRETHRLFLFRENEEARRRLIIIHWMQLKRPQWRRTPFVSLENCRWPVTADWAETAGKCKWISVSIALHEWLPLNPKSRLVLPRALSTVVNGFPKRPIRSQTSGRTDETHVLQLSSRKTRKSFAHHYYSSA